MASLGRQTVWCRMYVLGLQEVDDHKTKLFRIVILLQLSLLVGCYEVPPTFKNNFSESTDATQLTFDTEPGETPSLDVRCSRDFDEISEAQSETESINQEENDPTDLIVCPRSSHPPPPPPPTPLASRAANCDRKEVTKRISVFWMKKELIS